MNFENIIGNDNIKNILTESIKQKNILHSYLFIGIEGIGKKLFAEQFSKNILCENFNGCGTCKSCIEFDSQNNPDFFVIEPDGNSIKIEQIRQLQKKIIEKPIVSDKRVYIINDADKMTVEAQNCLLKTLEEPQSFVVMILIASNENNLLTTVKSRCTKMYFNKLSNDELNKFLFEKFGDVHFDKNMIELSGGSIKKGIDIIEKADILKKAEELVSEIHSINELQMLKYNTYFNENKENVLLILDYMTVLLYNKLKSETFYKMAYINSINIVQKAKNKILNSNNFDMTIDWLLFNIWEK